MRKDLEQEFVDFAQAQLDRLRQLAQRLCGDSNRGDDIVQTALIKMYTRWPRIRAVDNLEAYARTVVVRTFVDERRLLWAKVRLFDRPPETAGLDEAAAVDDRVLVQRALLGIRPNVRAVLVLRFLCDLPVGEVASILGCAEGTVKSRTSIGLRKLRDVLDRLPGSAPSNVDMHTGAGHER